ncbi:MAG TPA: hypothetical protein VFJ94_10795 [Intrasporangium sp.]|uniref:hypothetical protein n=1 Tax=Intrasporangium sp. TaxID=1925024 RepID=UPI002D776DDE|nr:hypothetical protein [Intrasporangium sp.]HET7398998.1 hypothetical protein [Intrasporangium sp.]
MPPTRYLGWSWPDWCETDCLLDRAVHEHDRRLCGCGCGFWTSESHGDEGDGEFVAEVAVCWARAAIEKATEGGELPPGAVVWARRATDDD